ncbi:MAG: type III secretion system export apparatus subunit SctS [Paracoccaceae bacterium]
MDSLETLYLGKQSILLVFYLSMPVIAAATGVGLVVALVQTLIQLQEQTLSFAVKLATVIGVFFLWGGWMSAEMMNFQNLLLDRIGAP